MELNEIPAGPLTIWTSGNGQPQVVAGDADCVRGFILERKNQDDWRVLGSPDQREGIFLAAYATVLPAHLDNLTLNGERLLPDQGHWQEIGMDGLALFTNDSGGVVLRRSK